MFHSDQTIFLFDISLHYHTMVNGSFISNALVKAGHFKLFWSFISTHTIAHNDRFQDLDFYVM